MGRKKPLIFETCISIKEKQYFGEERVRWCMELFLDHVESVAAYNEYFFFPISL